MKNMKFHKVISAKPTCTMLLLSMFTLQAFAQSPLGPVSPKTGLLIRDDIVRKLIHTSSGDLAHDYVTQLSLWDRSAMTEGYGKAAEWMAAKAKEYGLQKVTIERFVSDGKVEYFGNPTTPLWKVKKGELWMTKPFEVRITTHAEVPMSLARLSRTATVESELVDIGTGLKDKEYPDDIKGKIVFTSSNPNAVYQKAIVERGAAGIVSYWSVPDWDLLNRQPGDFPDQIGWTALPAPAEGAPETFAFLISSRRAQEMKTVMRQTRIHVRAEVETEIVPGTLDVVSGILPGSKYPDEEIVVTAHLDHYKPGANDNASGSASALEIVRTLNELIKNGTLAQPLRSIRFLWVPEYVGTRPWILNHQDDPVNRIANLNFDMLGENLKTTNALFSVSYTPDSNPSFLNAVMESILDFMNKYNDERYPPQKDFHIISVKGTRNRLQGRMVPYTTGTDHELFNNLKIPGTGPLGWPDDNYHSSEDTPDKVDPTQLHRVISLGLMAMTTIAYLDDANAVDLATLSFFYGKRRIAQSEFEAEQSLVHATATDFAEADEMSAKLVKHVYLRERATVKTSKTFAHSKDIHSAIDAIAGRYDGLEKASLVSLSALADESARKLGVTRAAPAVSEIDRNAARLFPSRIKGKELFSIGYVSQKLADDESARIQEMMQAIWGTFWRLQGEGVSDLRLMGLPDAPAYYADGKRSILEIRDGFSVEYGPISTDAMILYFRAFEKAGLMTIRTK